MSDADRATLLYAAELLAEVAQAGDTSADYRDDLLATALALREMASE